MISLRQANRYLLKRQHLLTPCSDPLQAVRDACGLQAQVPSTPALSLRARVAGFRLEEYDRLILQERTLVRTWAMRGTVHTLPTDQLPIFTQVYADPAGLSDGALLALDLLKDGPQTRKQLAARAVAERGLPKAEAERLFGPWGGILSRLARAGYTVHAPNVGADVPLVRVQDWLGTEPRSYPVEELEDMLLQAYLHGYGPATVYDFAHFTNFKVGRARSVFARATNLAEVQVEGSKLPHFLPTADLPELLATTGNEPAPVKLLPRFDSLVLVHKNKERIMDPAWRRNIFGAGAQVEAVVLVDGRVAGTWKAKAGTRGLRFQFNPFGDQPAEGVAEEARRLADWYGLEQLDFTVKAEAPQAAVAERKARIESAGNKLKAPRLGPNVAFTEPLRQGSLIHVPALPGLAVPPDRLSESVQSYLAWLSANKLAMPAVNPEQLEVRPISDKVTAINPKPGAQTAALLDSDLAPLTDTLLKQWGAILKAAAKRVTPHPDHLTMLGWFLTRATSRQRRASKGRPPIEQMQMAIDDLLNGLREAPRALVSERAGEPWTPRKALRRAIQYLLEKQSGQP